MTIRSNVVVAVFDDAEQARCVMDALCGAPSGEGYVVPEAVLVRRDGDSVSFVAGFGIDVLPNGTVTGGAVVGGLVGAICSRLGALAGAGVGAADARRTVAGMRASLVSEAARKVYDGETAIVALVTEEEPAFDAVLGDGPSTVARYDAQAVADEVRLTDEERMDIAHREMAREVADLKAHSKEELRARFLELRKAVDGCLARLGDDGANADAADMAGDAGKGDPADGPVDDDAEAAEAPSDDCPAEESATNSADTE